MADSYTNQLLADAERLGLGFYGLAIRYGPPPGQVVTGNVDEVQAIDPDMPLGMDPREMLKIEIIRPAPAWALNDEIQVNGERARVVLRYDNPSNPFIKFYAQKISAKDT